MIHKCLEKIYSYARACVTVHDDHATDMLIGEHPEPRMVSRQVAALAYYVLSIVHGP
ncbi:hypothetical protein D3C80_1965730 [compost metagenome]